VRPSARRSYPTAKRFHTKTRRSCRTAKRFNTKAQGRRTSGAPWVLIAISNPTPTGLPNAPPATGNNNWGTPLGFDWDAGSYPGCARATLGCGVKRLRRYFVGPLHQRNLRVRQAVQRVH
jgi:hypothetical protein